MSLRRGEVLRPTAANQHGLIDFVDDQLLRGHKFRALTVINQWCRESIWQRS